MIKMNLPNRKRPNEDSVSSAFAFKSKWWTALLFTVLALAMPHQAFSSGYVEGTSNYMVYLSGTDQLTIKVPVFDKDGYDTWIRRGRLYCKEKGSSSETLVLFWGVNDGESEKEEVPGDPAEYKYNTDDWDVNSNDYWVWTHMSTGAGGTMYCKVESDYHEIELTKDKMERKKVYTNYGNDHIALNARWLVPDEFRGKTLTFRWDLRRSGHGRDRITPPGFEEFDIDIPAKPATLDITVSRPIIHVDYPGKLVVPWIIGTNKVKKVQVIYADANNKQKTETIPDTVPQGLLPIDATVPHRSFHLKVDYYDSEGKLVKGNMSEPESLPMVHAPINFTATPQDDGTGSVLLTWDTDCFNDEDLLDGDLFEIERSITGREEDFSSIGSEMFDTNLNTYSFKDSTILASLNKDFLDENGMYSKITYRIRRGATLTWGWGKNNPTVAIASATMGDMRLLEPVNAQSDWASESNRTVKVTWDYKKSTKQYWYVWDERAKMRLKVNMYNRADQPVDSIVYTLTAKEIKEKTKTITLLRPCVKYDLQLEVIKNDFPVNSSYRYVKISSASDWDELVSMSSKNVDERYNVVLENDIELVDIVYQLGRTVPFRGFINGNGHTIKVNNFTPISQTYNAFINDIKISTYYDVSLGIQAVSFVDKATNTTFENCVVSTRIDNGIELQSAGFVNDGNGVSIKNCLSKLESFRKSDNASPSEWAGFILNATNCDIQNSFSFTEVYLANAIARNTSHFYDFYKEGTVTLSNCYSYGFNAYNHQGTLLTRDQVRSLEHLNLLGDEWEPSDNNSRVMPKFKTFNSAEIFDTLIVKVSGPANMYYYEVSGKVGKTLTVNQRQSSVVLSWEIVDGVVDYCEVLCREIGTEQFKVISPKLYDNVYEDKDTKPTKKYEYVVRSTVSCEGTKYEYTDTVPGHCKQTGLVVGYVRFSDGTGIAGLNVSVTAPDGTTVGSQTTDDAGKFEFDNLSYLDQQAVTYVVTISSNENLVFEKGKGSYNVEFSEKTNYFELNDIVVTSGYRFSGYVMYEGTSIPVPGVNFTVGGHKVYNASGKLFETDTNGRISFYVLGGKQLDIIASKDGHTFSNGGKFTHTFNSKLADIYFYDQTKVKLIGRIAGGHVQGDLPLGNSLSRNNLGTDLTMVLTLEGDNTSQLVFDNINPLLTERYTVFTNKALSDKAIHQTKVRTYRKRMVVLPDSTTGEFTLMLPPVKWKIQQVYCNGYPTLLQEGKASDVVDLTNSLKFHVDTYQGSWKDIDGFVVTHPQVEYNDIYNCIYHNPMELEYSQVNFDNFEYFGDMSYTAYNDEGKKEVVPLAYEGAVKDKDGEETTVTKYTFGYPVFNINRPYIFRLSAQEKYYWNNNHMGDTIDVVQLSGGKVIVQNGMESSTHKEVVDLDSVGTGYITLRAAQATYNLTHNDALRTVTWTLDYGGTTTEAKPMKAYILNIYAIPGASDILNSEKPTLVDILRDPPGSGSFATLSKGSTLKYSYSMDMKWSAGLQMKFSEGTSLKNYYGVTTTSAPGAIGPSYGIIQDAKTGFEYSNDFTFSGSGNRSYNYTMTATEDIKTSSGQMMVGADADVYIGVVQNNIVRPAVAIRAVSDSIFNQMVALLAGGKLPTGKADKVGHMAEIAQGKDEYGNVYHLVRHETLSMGAEITSTFVHTQKYILGQLIPELFEQCRSLIFVGNEAQAQLKADSTKKVVYLSLVAPTDSAFAVMNMHKGEPVYYTLKQHQDPKTRIRGMSYCIVEPTGYKHKDSDIDEVQKYCGIIYEWVKMIRRNEEEKLSATDLVRNFDVDGGTSTTYSENFESQYANTFSWSLPLGFNKDNYFSGNNSNDGDILLNTGNVFGKTFGPFIVKLLGKVMQSGEVQVNGSKETGDAVQYTTEVNFTGSLIKFLIYPTMSYSVTPKNTKTETYSRKESFSIGMNGASHLDFDVYRANSVIGTTNKRSDDVMDVFNSQNFYALTNENYDYLYRHFDFDQATNDFYRSARGFVYRTRGGATALPWENERKTIFAQPGTVLDARTKKLQNPKIWMDKQSVSGVPFGQPARFKVYVANDTEEPNATGSGLHSFLLVATEANNPHGAKLFIEGSPVTGSGRSIFIPANTVLEKTLEVYAGEDFDYENLQLTLTTNLYDLSEYVNFDVHYVHTAGDIAISTPGDKWVMNTDAASDEKGYFLPVVIDGFNPKQKNFDHIEFQYKETNRGDDYWTNLCSYYDNDTLMAKASGTKKKIPEEGIIKTSFYGGEIITEKSYDLRAMLFVRNGSGFITSSSKVLTGIKDTRRPAVFGTPEPSDGVLDIGENIVFDFTEAIEHNFLDPKVCFEVKSEVNNKNISEDVSLRFDGEGFMETEVERNFTGKDITLSVMIKPDATDKEMPIFSHGTDNKKLQLWLTPGMKLKAVVNNNSRTDQVCESTEAIDATAFQQVAMVIRHKTKVTESDTLRLLYGSKTIGKLGLEESYTGTGKLIFGRTNELNPNSKTRYYQGRMMEARLWYRALDDGLVGQTYGSQRLTGHEVGLVDYYPMNDGVGYYATDKAMGAHAKIIGASWANPKGMSLHLEWEDHGLALSDQALTRTAEEDYTLMFWFKTNMQGRGALIGNGAGYSDDIGAKNQFFIGFEGESLHYRTNGMDIVIPGDYSDNQWHHYAMTVNRSRNLGNIYMDRVLRATFAVDTLGGISGGYPLIGATLHQSRKDNLVADTHNWLRGNIDEIYMFEQALPATLISSYSMKCPYGDEAGLMTYIGFNKQQRTSNNDLQFMPYAYSQVLYKDEMGNIKYQLDSLTHLPTNIPVRDYPFAKDVSEEHVIAHITQDDTAPVQPYEDLKNLNFNFVGRDNQLLVSIDEPLEYINKCNLYVTVRNIPDLNGNYMASPSTIGCLVDCNPLRWDEKTKNVEMYYGVKVTFDMRINNVSGSQHTYKVENCPQWLTVSPSTNVIGAKSEEFVSFTVSKDLNVGRYDEIIYLTDENGLTEALSLHLTVIGQEPNWTVDNRLRHNSMNIVGRVVIGDTKSNEIDIDPNDIVGCFDQNGVCHGVANISYDEATGKSLLFMTVYDDDSDMGTLYFKLWHYATGKEMLLVNYDEISFVVSKVYGDTSDPCIFYANNQYVQTLSLKEGWNWVSFNVWSTRFYDLNGLLAHFPWQNGDIITDNTNNVTLIYKDSCWNLSSNIKEMQIMPRYSYAVRVSHDIDVQVAGFILKDKGDRSIIAKPGWNSIGYTPMVNLPVETALAGYSGDAMDGDVIKSHDEFAVFNGKGQVGYWEGNLQYMKPGEGYMLLRHGEKSARFYYPFFEPGTQFFETSRRMAPAVSSHAAYSNTMSLSAVATGIQLEEGDRLLAFADGELRGAATMTADSLFYMSIGGDKEQGLSFALEREGEVIATTAEIITYKTNAVVGRPNLPTSINFTHVGLPQHGWYTLAGIKLNKRPVKKGVYIYNGKKIVVGD